MIGAVVAAASAGRRGGRAAIAPEDARAIARDPAGPSAGIDAVPGTGAPVHPPHPLAGEAPEGARTLADASRVVSIEMYSAAWCEACGRAKAWMRDQDIAFHEVDVDRRAGALAQLTTLNPRRSLPTFDVDGHVVVGFDEPRLRTAIDEAARRTAREHR